jgi:hypothetical protein
LRKQRIPAVRSITDDDDHLFHTSGPRASVARGYLLSCSGH